MSSPTIVNAKRPTGFAVSSIVLGIIGWFASFQLLTEFIKTLQNPGHIPNCNISVLVTCGPNMDSPQGSVLGFSNTIIGVTAFAIPIVVGFALLAGARFKNWFWRLYQLGMLGGFVFILWLAWQSIFELHTLCPWCMVVWLVMIPLFWITLFTPHANGHIAISERARERFVALQSWAWVLILVTYLLIAAVAQFQLDWFLEFRRM